MENIVYLIVLAVVQGFSEWLPISSSGHLVLFQHMFGIDPGLAFDVALHFGTLMAVFVYFGKDIIDIIEDVLKGRWKSKNAKLFYYLIVGSIPAGIIGFVFKKYIESAFYNIGLVAIGFGITSLLLFIASLDLRIVEKTINGKNSFLIGCAQALAIMPGISRSGSTISMGLLQGFSMKDSLKFSFLLSIPAIFGASILEIGSTKLPAEFIWPTLVAFIIGMFSIHLLFRVVANSKKNLRWFAVYTLLLALGIGVYLIIR